MSGYPADPRPAPGSVHFFWISHQWVVFRASWSSCHARLSLPAGSRGAPVDVPAGRSERLPGGARPTLQATLALPLTGAWCPSARACQAELSARVRRDESLREAPLSPGLPAAGKKGGVLAVGRADEGGPPPWPGFTTDLVCLSRGCLPHPLALHTHVFTVSPGGPQLPAPSKTPQPSRLALAHSALGLGPYRLSALCLPSGQRTR